MVFKMLQFTQSSQLYRYHHIEGNALDLWIAPASVVASVDTAGKRTPSPAETHLAINRTPY